MARTDAVVVGAGPNGLAAALTLAREGFRVTVLEAAHEPGGGTRTVEDPHVPGLYHDHCSAVHPFGAASPFLRSLPLERYGLTWRHAPVAAAHPLDDEPAGLILRDLAATAAVLGRDGPVWRGLFGHASRRFDAVAGDLLGPLVRVPRHPVSTARVGAVSVLPAATVASWFPTPRGAALFGGLAAHAIQPLHRPMTAAVGVMLGAAGHAAGWPVAEGGSASIWRAMVALLEDLGGQVVTGARIDDLAELPRCRVALLDVTPTALAHIAGDRLPAPARRRAARWRYGPAAFKVDYAVRGGVPWTDEACRRAGTLHLAGRFDQLAAAERAVHDGGHPDRPYVLVSQPAVADPTRTVADPSGGGGDITPLWAYAHVPHGDDVDSTARIDAQIERFAPGFLDRVVSRRITGPADLEAFNPNNVGGDIAGGATDPRQLLARPRPAIDPYRTAVPGLYLCSASTPPGAGVHGLSGYHAARSALRVLTA